MVEKFCLKWNDFQTNTTSSFAKLQEDKDLLDITLISQDEVHVQAHKVVLASSSSLFKNLLTKMSLGHNYLYLNGILSSQLFLLLDYIYKGEALIYQSEIELFLNAAQILKIEGLMNKVEDGEAMNEQNNQDIDESDHQMEDPVVKYERVPLQQIEKINCDISNDITEIDKKVSEMIETDSINRTFTCKICGKVNRHKGTMGYHVETHLDGIEVSCHFCEKTFRSRQLLSRLSILPTKNRFINGNFTDPEML